MKRYVIDSAALLENLETVRRRAKGAKIYAVLKGNAYGLGIVNAAHILAKANVEAFAVTEASEAETLRREGFEQEILIIRSTSNREDLRTFIRLGCVCTVGSSDAAIAIRAAAQELDMSACVHIEIDTGMGRTGFSPSALEDIKNVYNLGAEVVVTGIYTHFHSAFSNQKATRAQFDLFMSTVTALQNAGYETGCVHAANSSALMLYDWAVLDAVRVGSALLGRLSFRTKGDRALKKVGYIESTIDSVGWLSEGSTVGYGAGCKLKKAKKVAIIPVGYYHGFNVSQDQDLFRFRDGVRGCLSNIRNIIFPRSIKVTVNGKEVKVLGHIGMMHTAVDVTKVDCSTASIAVLQAKPTMIKGLERYYK